MLRKKFGIIITLDSETSRNDIETTMKSIERQTLSFEKKIAVVMVSDNKYDTDPLKELYCKKYPNNIAFASYKRQSDIIKAVSEKMFCDYVSVIRGGTVFSDNCFEEALLCFDKMKGSVDVVSVNAHPEDTAYAGYRKLFKQKAVLYHLQDKYNAVPFEFEHAVMKWSHFCQNVSDVNCLTPFNIITKILDRHQKIGFLPENANVLLPEAETVKYKHNDFYIILSEVEQTLCDIRKIKGFIPFYAQHFGLYRIVNGLNLAADYVNAYCPDKNKYEYVWDKLSNVISLIDDKIIMSFGTTRFNKIFLLEHKYNNTSNLDLYYRDIVVMYGNTPTYKVSSFPVRYELMNIIDGKFILEGIFANPGYLHNNNVEYFVIINGQKHHITPVERYNNRYKFDKPFFYEIGFKVELPLSDDEYVIEFAQAVDGHLCKRDTIEYMEIFPMDNSFEKQYYYKSGYSVSVRDKKLICKKCSEKMRRDMEKEFQAVIRQAEPERAEEIINIRNYYWNSISNRSGKKQIWLISDRLDRADDNGEALFNYICKNHKEIDCYFVLSHEAQEYDSIKNVGKVIEPYSEEHLKLQLTADFNISSQMNQAVYNPFNDDLKYYRDISRSSEFIFLQHGVIHNFHGKIIGRYGRDYAGFVTSAYGEYESLLLPLYGYTEKQMWLTGLPRWDRLYRDEKKIITIMPTWRKFLTKRLFDEEQNTMVWQVSQSFTESEYFKFYNALLNDERLIKTADEYGYHICFMPHVNFLKHVDDFTHNEHVEFFSYDKKYREIFAESDLVVTDYSSAVFDFAYLYKPVLYSQFDKEKFYMDHTVKKGYFDFEIDGFGEVMYTYEDTVNMIIEYIINDCRLKEKYRKRIEGFFAFSDHNCCKRVYDKIAELENNHITLENNNESDQFASEC